MEAELPDPSWSRWSRDSRIIRDPLFFREVAGPTTPCVPGPKARLSATHARDAMNMGIFDTLRAAHVRARIRCHVCPAFSVFKSPELARLILWPRHLNHMPCGDMRLADRAAIHSLVRRFRYMCDDDGDNAFYRFPLHPDIRHEFCARIRGFGIVQLNAMCMGWSCSMAPCHSAFEVIAKHAQGDDPDVGTETYADNTALAGTSFAAVRRLICRWQHSARRAGMPMKNRWLQPKQRSVWLGLLLDLRRKTIGVPPTTLRAIRSAIDTMAHSAVSYRYAWAVIGRINYYLYMMDIPLFRYANFTRWCSRIGRMLHERSDLWDRKAVIWPALVKDLTALGDDISFPSPIRDDPTTTTTLYSDASLSGGGFIILGDRPTCASWRWTHYGDPIHRLEALAALRAVESCLATSAPGTHLHLLCDNSVVVHCWQKGRARDSRLAATLEQIRRQVSHHGCSLSMTWIPTKDQLADPLSRR